MGRYDQADVVRWVCFEQYSHDPYVAVARFLHHLPDPPAPELLAEIHEKGYAALNILDSIWAPAKFLLPINTPSPTSCCKPTLMWRKKESSNF